MAFQRTAASLDGLHRQVVVQGPGTTSRKTTTAFMDSDTRFRYLMQGQYMTNPGLLKRLGKS